MTVLALYEKELQRLELLKVKGIHLSWVLARLNYLARQRAYHLALVQGAPFVAAKLVGER